MGEAQFLLFLVVLYLLTLALVSLWSDISDDFHEKGHWFGDAVLLLFWDCFGAYCLMMSHLHRHVKLPSWFWNLPQTLSPEFIRRAAAYAYYRRLFRQKGGRYE